MRAGYLVWPVAALMLTGCINLGPDYERPEVETPEAYIGQDIQEETLANLQWWDVFNDPALQALITESIGQNRDLRLAVARVNEARAQLGISFADQFPTVDGAAGFNRGNLAEQILPGAGVNEVYQVSATARYEVDFWGKFRRGTESARAALLASEEGQRTILTSLIADVATTYLLLRDFDAQVEIAQDTVDARSESTRIIRARFDKGTVPLLDVNQAEIEEADAMARLAALRRRTREAENLLNVLVGSNPRPILRGNTLQEQMFAVEVPAGLPSQLLERRPDVRAAEQRLAAQTARIGIAQAARFPSIALTATGGYINEDLDDLLESDSELWSVNVDIFGPIFDAAKRRNQVQVEIARTEQAVNEYEQTVLQAFREVEDALAGVRYYHDEFEARTMQVRAARSASELSRARYDGGVTDYLEVLDSDRSLFDAQLSRSAVNRQELVSVVQLYKALGGGWELGREQDAETEAVSPE